MAYSPRHLRRLKAAARVRMAELSEADAKPKSEADPLPLHVMLARQRKLITSTRKGDRKRLRKKSLDIDIGLG